MLDKKWEYLKEFLHSIQHCTEAPAVEARGHHPGQRAADAFSGRTDILGSKSQFKPTPPPEYQPKAEIFSRSLRESSRRL